MLLLLYFRFFSQVQLQVSSPGLSPAAVLELSAAAARFAAAGARAAAAARALRRRPPARAKP